MIIRYFSFVRSKIGKNIDELTPPPAVKTIDDLCQYLIGLGDNYRAALADQPSLRFAHNHAFAPRETPINPNDEIGIFPPVTGG